MGKGVTIVGMEVYQVILLIVVLASFFYVSVLLYVVGQIREFRRKRLFS